MDSRHSRRVRFKLMSENKICIALRNSFPFRGKAGMGVGAALGTHPHPNLLLRYKCSLAPEGEGTVRGRLRSPCSDISLNHTHSRLRGNDRESFVRKINSMKWTLLFTEA
jgi:hypothetical protein